MILTDEMLAVAFRYRSTNLWELLSDSDVFAFRLSDGETGYCSVMGFGGEHFALVFYRGEKGFSTYLRTLAISDCDFSNNETIENIMTFDCINCDFMAANVVRKNTKKIIREYADAQGLKIPRPNGWPDFTRHEPYKEPFCITREEDARDIIEALHAAIAVAEKVTLSNAVDLGFDMKGNYPTPEGGKIVPYLLPKGDGTYDWSTIALPALYEPTYDVLKFNNDVLVGMLKSLPRSGVFQMRLIHMPMPVGEPGDKAASLPALLLCMNANTGDLFPVPFMEEDESDLMPILVDLANTFRRKGKRPLEIQVEDARTEALLKDFCQQSGIILSYESELPELNNGWRFLVGSFMRQDFM